MNVVSLKRGPIFQEDGSIRNPDIGETRALAPNLFDINEMLHALFNPAFVQAYPDAWIEIAYGRPEAKPDQAQNWPVFDLKDAAVFAEAKNKAGYNVYVGPALRAGSQPRSGRANFDHVLTSAFAWVDFDNEGDAERVKGVLDANNLVPAMIVTTGTVPHRRAHLYFKIDGLVTPAQIGIANTALVKLLGTNSVQDANRIMRLAGTINYPSEDKRSRGYVEELTSLRVVKDAPAYKLERLIALAPTSTLAAPGDHFAAYGYETAHKDQNEIKEWLDKVGGPDKWHKPMLAATGKMLGHGWNDLQIKLACAPHCKGGFDDPDIPDLINEARVKWGIPDPGDGPIARKPAAPPKPIHATPYAWKDPATIPRREWLYGDLLVRKIVSATISPGGIGKSSLVAAEALAMVSGKALLGVTPPEQLRVWLWNLEDPQEETVRKIQAAAKHYNLKPDDIGDRLLVDSGREQKLVIARMTKDGAMVLEPVIDNLVAEILARGIDVLVIDPFVSCHEVAENDNSMMDAVVSRCCHLTRNCS